MSDPLHIVIRTPRGVEFEADVVSIRVPTPTGKVGLRARVEPALLSIEPGLILLRADTGTIYAGTSGGLLRTDGRTATIVSPIAIIADDSQTLVDRLDTALSVPTEETELRGMLGRLEADVLRELQRRDAGKV